MEEEEEEGGGYLEEAGGEVTRTNKGGLVEMFEIRRIGG